MIVQHRSNHEHLLYYFPPMPRSCLYKMLSLITSKVFEVLVLPHFWSFRPSSSSSEQAVSTDTGQSSTTSHQCGKPENSSSLWPLFLNSQGAVNFHGMWKQQVSPWLATSRRHASIRGGRINGTGNRAYRLYPKWPHLLNLATTGTKPLLKIPTWNFTYVNLCLLMWLNFV